jgi:hypothetical protein
MVLPARSRERAIAPLRVQSAEDQTWSDPDTIVQTRSPGEVRNRHA